MRKPRGTFNGERGFPCENERESLLSEVEARLDSPKVDHFPRKLARWMLYEIRRLERFEKPVGRKVHTVKGDKR